MGRLTNAELESTARSYAKAKALEAEAKAQAKPLGAALLAELAARGKDQLRVGDVTVTRRSKRTVRRDVAVVIKALARRKDLLHRVVRVSASDWATAVKAGEISEDLDREVYEGTDESAPWVEVAIQ